MATRTPHSTPTASTETSVARERISSLVRNRANRLNSLIATIFVAAYTTTAPSAAAGTISRSGRNASRATRVVATAAKLVSWVRPPTAWTIAVRLPLLLTGKPWSRPAPRLAPPRASSSRLASIASPLLSANARAVRTLSVKPTNATPRAAGTIAAIVDGSRWGMPGTGRPAGCPRRGVLRGRRGRKPPPPPSLQRVRREKRELSGRTPSRRSSRSPCQPPTRGSAGGPRRVARRR